MRAHCEISSTDTLTCKPERFPGRERQRQRRRRPLGNLKAHEVGQAQPHTGLGAPRRPRSLPGGNPAHRGAQRSVPAPHSRPRSRQPSGGREPAPSPRPAARLLHERRSAPHVARADVSPSPHSRNAETPWNAASLLNRGCCWGAAAPLIGWLPAANRLRQRRPPAPSPQPGPSGRHGNFPRE